MCLRTRPGTPSGPAALWLGVQRKVSCMMAGVIQPEIVGIEDVGVGRAYVSHGKGAPIGGGGSGDRPTFSICVTIATTSSWAVMRMPVVSSRTTERYVGREGMFVTPSVVRIIDLSTTLGFVTNKRSIALPYRMQRRVWACRTSILATLRISLKQYYILDGIVS
jgi:hypothetical protein